MLPELKSGRFQVLKENWESLNVFMDLETQFDYVVSEKGDAVFQGINYASAIAHLNVVYLGKAEMVRDCWALIRFCEQVLLNPDSYELRI